LRHRSICSRRSRAYRASFTRAVTRASLASFNAVLTPSHTMNAMTTSEAPQHNAPAIISTSARGEALIVMRPTPHSRTAPVEGLETRAPGQTTQDRKAGRDGSATAKGTQARRTSSAEPPPTPRYGVGLASARFGWRFFRASVYAAVTPAHDHRRQVSARRGQYHRKMLRELLIRQQRLGNHMAQLVCLGRKFFNVHSTHAKTFSHAHDAPHSLQADQRVIGQ